MAGPTGGLPSVMTNPGVPGLPAGAASGPALAGVSGANTTSNQLLQQQQMIRDSVAKHLDDPETLRRYQQMARGFQTQLLAGNARDPAPWMYDPNYAKVYEGLGIQPPAAPVGPVTQQSYNIRPENRMDGLPASGVMPRRPAFDAPPFRRFRGSPFGGFGRARLATGGDQGGIGSLMAPRRPGRNGGF